jgi:cyanate permease
MNKDLITWKDGIEALLYSLLAIAGSVARTLSDNLIQKKKTKSRLILMLISNAIVAGFCGLMIVPLSNIMNLNLYWSLFMAGMSGWTGSVFLTVLEKIAFRRLENGTTLDKDTN